MCVPFCRQFQHAFYILYSSLPISRGLFSPHYSRETPIPRLLGVFLEFKSLPKFFLPSKLLCCVQHRGISYRDIWRVGSITSTFFGAISQMASNAELRWFRWYKPELLFNKQSSIPEIRRRNDYVMSLQCAHQPTKVVDQNWPVINIWLFSNHILSKTIFEIGKQYIAEQTN